MSRSELHDWECDIEELSGNNADKMLDVAQDIYNTAFVRVKFCPNCGRKLSERRNEK